MRVTQSPGNALREYGLAELSMAIDRLVMHGSHVHSDIHQARKAIRRTRAMLALGGAHLGPGAHLVDRQLRRVNRRLSPLRDAHALVQTLDRLRIKARDDTTVAALDHALRIAKRRRAALSRSPAFAETLLREQAVLVALRSALQGLPFASLSTATVTDAMDAMAHKCDAARERACAQDDAEDWHRWRRCMRKRSQQHRAAIAAGLIAPDSEFDKALTEQLGVMQDLSLLVAHCGDDSPFPKASHQLRRFAERTLARQRKRIRSVVVPL